VKAGRTLSLVVRRVIAASPSRLFEAWTTPSQLQAWWGPRGVRCTLAEIDLRVGGGYRIGNELPDGCVLFISGEFLSIDPPRQLAYTWWVETGGSRPSRDDAERVTVRFEPRGAGTEVIVVHERIEDERARDQHAEGWDGCLEGLARADLT
jgi:uncharacterized protein YndB with AHSA1/START domain